ncbi:MULTISPECIES: BTAD domain-containing putative transcriptional regulator [unclassified Adlercreutzia]|uniref:AfsR/SARP family transcriptional regulator n=1 Tax=unclassified Adlercreutzia TaxID=2636013 RepID=UPI0013ECD9D8|nr:MULTISPECIES: BTAD domain-containing putative transcriptional regulator [unclassified Adlercreutzia]
MPTFVEACCCRGRRPEGVIARRHFSRSDLIARLLRDRHVARFVVAPAGFGKSALAFEYADVVCSFQHVFWINGRSPCFLRDLDADVLLSSVCRLDPQAALVVCEDVPRLDDDRTLSFARLVDALLDRRIEVIVTCVPSADSFAPLLRDRMLLRGVDLLLSDEELSCEVASGRMGEELRRTCAPGERVACLRWGEGGARTLMEGVRREELPGDVRLGMLVLLALGEGSVEDLAVFLPCERACEIARLLEDGYAFLGIDGRAGTYRAVSLEAGELGVAFGHRMDDMAAASACSARDELAARLAEELFARGRLVRACRLMVALAAKGAAATWACAHGWELLEHGEAHAFCEMHEDVARGATGMHDVLSSLRGWACLMLDDVPEALAYARRVTRSSAASPLDRVRANVLLAREGAPEVRERAVLALEGLMAPTSRTPLDEETARAADDTMAWPLLARLAAAPEAGERLRAWERAAAADASGSPACPRGLRNALLLGAAWLLDDLACEDGTGQLASQLVGLRASDGRLAADMIASFVGAALAAACAHGAPSWYALAASEALERAVARDGRLAAFAPAPATAATLRRAEVACIGQRERYRRSQDARRGERREFQLAHPDPFRAHDTSAAYAITARTAVPTLFVRLFGGLEARIGDELVDPRAFSRVKTRTLLAMLVLNRGREVARDRLAALMWPAATPEAARKNFYSIWSKLNRALRVGEHCPYLIRSQNGCRLDPRLVTSDVAAFEALSRTLLFGVPESEGWEELYAQVCDVYADDLMPGEEDNEIIASMRDRYRVQLIDGLIATSIRLSQRGEARGSVWFAREALRRDAAREDAYLALMEAQVAADQRASAIETYFACRRFLSDELGIDPSAKTVELYRSIIETEEPLA